MNEAVIGAIGAVIGTVLGLVLTKAIEFFKTKKGEHREDKGQDAKIKESEIDKAAGLYREIIADLREDIDKLMVYLHELEKDHLSCREENASLRAEVKNLNQRISYLEKEAINL